MHLLIHPSSVGPFIHSSIHPSMHLSIRSSICLIHPPARPSTHPFLLSSSHTPPFPSPTDISLHFSFSWLFFINPNFYGYASMMRLIMPGIETGCNFDSTIECYPSTGTFWLEHFGFHFIQPYLSLLVSWWLFCLIECI